MRNRYLIATLSTLIATTLLYAHEGRAGIVRDGLASHWTFDEADIDRGTAKDVWGDNNGTMIGDPPIVEGRFRQALAFDESPDVVVMAHVPFVGSGDVTLCAWVNFTTADVDDYPKIIIIGNGAVGESVQLYLNIDSDEIHAAAWGAGAVNAKQPGLNDGTWHYVAGVFSGGDTATLYADGKLVGSDGLAYDIAPTGELNGIGGHPDGARQWVGSIDEVSVYDQALTAEEVAQNFESKSVLAVNPAAKLATYWGETKAAP